MYNLTHLEDDRLLSGFAALAARECGTTAAQLAHIAEIDHRHLFLEARFESMRAYCMHVLHLSEDAAARRIQVARLARELPALFPALADGRLHLTAVSALASRLNRTNVEEWIAAAANKTLREIAVLIAHRHPQPEALRLDDGISPQVVASQTPSEIGHVLKHVQPVAIPVAPKVRPKITPISPGRYIVQVTFLKAAHDKLRHAQDLLSHAVPTGDVAQVLERGLDSLICELEKRKFGSAAKPRAPRAPAARRSIPAHVRHAVYKRDGARCSFVGRDGQRCASMKRLEFDHILPVARGGKSHVENLRLLCRAHNQHEAERVFGREFIARKASRRWSASP